MKAFNTKVYERVGFFFRAAACTEGVDLQNFTPRTKHMVEEMGGFQGRRRGALLRMSDT